MNSIPAADRPQQLVGVGIDEKLGGKVDLSLPVFNEEGQQVFLGSLFKNEQPTILSLVYYSCPGLCNFHLNGLIEGLKNTNWSAGQKFQLIALSFDASEKSTVATAKKKTYLNVYDRPGTQDGVHFLTASEDTIKKITESVGFKFKWNSEAKEWAHSSAAIFLTPEGGVSRYLHGIIFEPADLKLALSESSKGKIGNIFDKMIWYCFMYDPKKSKYVLWSFRLVQFGAIIMTLLMAVFLFSVWGRARKGEAKR